MKEIEKAVKYFDEQTGHFTDWQKTEKILDELNELAHAVKYGTQQEIIDECSDVATVAYHIATRNGYNGTPDDLFLQAYEKMKRRIESGERNYKNRDV